MFAASNNACVQRSFYLVQFLTYEFVNTGRSYMQNPSGQKPYRSLVGLHRPWRPRMRRVLNYSRSPHSQKTLRTPSVEYIIIIIIKKEKKSYYYFFPKEEVNAIRCYEISPKILAYQIFLTFAFLNLIGKTSDLAHYSRKWDFCSIFCLSI